RFSRDWSSDVCSSDLIQAEIRADLADVREPLADEMRIEMREVEVHAALAGFGHLAGDRPADIIPRCQFARFVVVLHEAIAAAIRSEERRVGKECTSVS